MIFVPSPRNNTAKAAAAAAATAVAVADVAAVVAATVEDGGLVERRRFNRPLPVPQVIESDDAAAWELWSQWSDL